MFDRPGPRVFALPPGADFPRELVNGLEQRLSSAPPAVWAKVEIFVNTRRMQRRLTALLGQGPARLLPRIRLVTDLTHLEPLIDLPEPLPPLRRKLELAQLVRGLLNRRPDLAPASAAFDMADSLAALLDEMQGEAVPFQRLLDLDVSHLAAHWADTRSFLQVVDTYAGDGLSDAQARARIAVERLATRWSTTPPDHPVLVAGSTGSRGTTAALMAAVAHLPQGALVLPGFDTDQPAQVWDALDDAMTAEDHPQFRFARLLRGVGMTPSDVQPWCDRQTAPAPARNRLISLALRPAPVTDQWRSEGPKLTDIAEATAGLCLIEAPSPRIEALAIALRLRRAAEDGVTAALISPDRVLTRQVSAALDRWGIEPDDSAGRPLHLSPPGRLVLQLAGLFGQALTIDALLALLKHPLTCSSDRRGAHMRTTRELELHLRRNGPAFPDAASIADWANRKGHPPDWAAWVGAVIDGLDRQGTAPLPDLVRLLRARADLLAAGPEGAGSGELFEKKAGIETNLALATLLENADFGGELTPAEFLSLLRGQLSAIEVTDPVQPHPGIMIWGTLEARVQGADLVILGGLTEGSWPALPAPDPWLSREMRDRVGLLLPERRIGLAAHDFQQAIGADEVVLSCALRNDEAETVPSRWLNRLTNLLDGLPDNGGRQALAEMRARGENWIAMAKALDAVPQNVRPESRPAPRPPVSARPDRLSVTQIQRLIRDPYAIYAREVLRLRPLDPLCPDPSVMLRGTVLHRVMEEFVKLGYPADAPDARDRLLDTARAILARDVPWPAARSLWLGRLARVADHFLSEEAVRQSEASTAALEVEGQATLPNGFTLRAEADRIDRLPTGSLVIYDYKTGAPPSTKQIEHYDKQLLLEAAMAMRGAFKDLPAAPVDHVAHIGLGSSPKTTRHPFDAAEFDAHWRGLEELIDKYRDPLQGFTARRSMENRSDASDYDHLSRYGEWDEADPPDPREVGE